MQHPMIVYLKPPLGLKHERPLAYALLALSLWAIMQSKGKINYLSNPRMSMDDFERDYKKWLDLGVITNDTKNEIATFLHMHPDIAQVKLHYYLKLLVVKGLMYKSKTDETFSKEQLAVYINKLTKNKMSQIEAGDLKLGLGFRYFAHVLNVLEHYLDLEQNNPDYRPYLGPIVWNKNYRELLFDLENAELKAKEALQNKPIKERFKTAPVETAKETDFLKINENEKWVMIHSSISNREAALCKHCGTDNAGYLLSYRKLEDELWLPWLTVSAQKIGNKKFVLGQIKGHYNIVPSVQYDEYLANLLKSKKIKKIPDYINALAQLFSNEMIYSVGLRDVAKLKKLEKFKNHPLYAKAESAIDHQVRDIIDYVQDKGFSVYLKDTMRGLVLEIDIPNSQAYDNYFENTIVDLDDYQYVKNETENSGEDFNDEELKNDLIYHHNKNHHRDAHIIIDNLYLIDTRDRQEIDHQLEERLFDFLNSSEDYLSNRALSF